MVRIGTVNAGTSPLLVPAVRDFRARRPGTTVEIISTQQAEVYTALVEGGLDLGLVNVLPGDDVPPELTATELAHGRPVVCCRPDDPLADQEAVTVEELRRQRFITMRAGYLMHRFTHRLFDGEPPPMAFSTDGADMGKLLVAEGLGVTVLPDYSIEEDPFVRAGVIVYRPIKDDNTEVTLLCLSRKGAQLAPAVRELQAELSSHARAREARLA
jgi:DNA-binding transcriptional LysR family regulator